MLSIPFPCGFSPPFLPSSHCPILSRSHFWLIRVTDIADSSVAFAAIMQRINAALALICFATALIVHAASAGNMVFFSVMVDKTGIAFDGDGPLMISIIAMIIGFLCGWISHGQWVHRTGTSAAATPTATPTTTPTATTTTTTDHCDAHPDAHDGRHSDGGHDHHDDHHGRWVGPRLCPSDGDGPPRPGPDGLAPVPPVVFHNPNSQVPCYHLRQFVSARDDHTLTCGSKQATVLKAITGQQAIDKKLQRCRFCATASRR